jgi:cobalt-zinc-cadmium efflux system outer membrane protein
MKRSFVLLYVVLSFSLSEVHAEADTLRIAMGEAEARMLRANVQLLAQRLAAAETQALVRQAAAWTNPSLGVEQNVYNQFTHRWLDTGPRGNTDIQIQQTFPFPGKRSSQVRMAELNAEAASYETDDLSRALRLALRTGMYDLFFLRRSLAFYDESIAAMGPTVIAMERVYEHRAVLLAELLRLKSLLFSLQKERLGIVGRIAETQETLSILLGDSSAVPRAYDPLIDLHALEAVRLDTVNRENAVAFALAHRADLRKVDAQAALDDVNLSYQKTVPLPDFTFGGHWSRNGGYVPNYFGITLGCELPIFNRNQGNIESAEVVVAADSLQRRGAREKVRREVESALAKAMEADQLFRSFDRSFPEEYRSLVADMVSNYAKRNMSVVEFTDFIESYRSSMRQMNELENDRADALEALNDAAGATFIAP